MCRFHQHPALAVAALCDVLRDPCVLELRARRIVAQRLDGAQHLAQTVAVGTGPLRR